MSVGKVATALTVTFAVSVVVLAAELLFLLRRRGSFPSPAKQLLNFLCLKLKPQVRVEPSESPPQKPPEDPVMDVFKVFEAKGVLCTIKEEDREDVESTSNSVEIEIDKVSLQKCLESEAAEERVEDTKTVFYSSCDSPMFFTPVGSPPPDTA